MQSPIIQIDTLKPIGTLVDLTGQFNARVGDAFTPITIQWTEGGSVKNLDGLHPVFEAAVGQGHVENNEVQMNDDAVPVRWVGDQTSIREHGQTILKLPPQAFSKSGLCYGYLALENDQGVRETSVDIWFKVLGGVFNMGIACNYFITDFQKALAEAKGNVFQTLDEIKKNYELQIQSAENAIDDNVATLKNLKDSVGAIQAQIDAGNVVTLRKHNEDITKLGGQISDTLSKMNLNMNTKYANLDELQKALPNGAEGLFVTDNGHRAVYRNNQWIDGGVFQSVGLGEGVVHTLNTDFAVHQVNVYSEKDALVGIYNAVNNTIVYQGEKVNKHYGDFTCFKFKADPNERTYTVSGTDFNVFGSTEDGTLAWSDNQSDGVTGPYAFTVPNNVVWVYVSFLTAKYDKFHCFTGSIKFDEAGRFLLDAPLASPISDGIVKPETTTFIEGRSNLFGASNSMNGIYNIANGKIVFQNAGVNKHFGDFTCFKFKVDSNEHTYTVSNTDFNVFGSTEDGTLAWSDNNVDGVTGPYTFTVPDNVVWVYVTFLTKRIKGYKAVVGKDLGQVGYRLSDKIEVPNKGALQVHVGKGYQYEHLIDAVNSINPDKDNVYTIYLHDTSNDYTGTTFDLLEELGGSSYLATIEDSKDNSQGFSIPAYVNLVGIGKVTLTAELPSNVTLNQSANFSTIELKQGNNKLSNLTIKIKNGRYAVHDESRDRYQNSYHIFKNVTFIHEGNVSGLWQAPHAYAAGTSGGSHYSYTNCIFDATESGGYPFDLHNYAPQKGVTVEADGVQLLSNKNQQYVMRFGFNGYSPLTTDQVKYAACFNDVFLKNVLGVGSVLVEPENSGYSCTNNYRIHNFTNLNLDIKNNQIKA